MLSSRAPLIVGVALDLDELEAGVSKQRVGYLEQDGLAVRQDLLAARGKADLAPQRDLLLLDDRRRGARAWAARASRTVVSSSRDDVEVGDGDQVGRVVDVSGVRLRARAPSTAAVARSRPRSGGAPMAPRTVMAIWGTGLPSRSTARRRSRPIEARRDELAARCRRERARCTLRALVVGVRHLEHRTSPSGRP